MAFRVFAFLRSWHHGKQSKLSWKSHGILSSDFCGNLVCCRQYPVLLQGETSVGKTSLITWPFCHFCLDVVRVLFTWPSASSPSFVPGIMENSLNCRGKVMEFYHQISVGTWSVADSTPYYCRERRPSVRRVSSRGWRVRPGTRACESTITSTQTYRSMSDVTPRTTRANSPSRKVGTVGPLRSGLGYICSISKY